MEVMESPASATKSGRTGPTKHIQQISEEQKTVKFLCKSTP